MSSERLSTTLAVAGAGSLLAVGSVMMVSHLAQSKLERTIINQAKGYLHVREAGTTNNAGFNDKAFEYKLYHLGWRPKWDWCAYFVKLVLLEAFSKLGLPDHYNFVKRYFTGSTQQTWKNFRTNPRKFFELSAKPERGAIVLWRNIYNESKGHTGIVVSRFGSRFRTIEGNRRNDVGYMTRSLSAYTQPDGSLQLLGFIRFKA